MTSPPNHPGKPRVTKRGLAETLFVDVPRFLIAVLILAGIAINFANVVSRHLFDSAIFWAEEILIFIVVWFVFVGVIAVTFQGRHLRMDLFAASIRPPWRSLVNALTTFAFIVLCGFVVLQSFEVVTAFNRTGIVSLTAGLPITIPHSALLVGFALMVVVVILRIRAYLSGDFGDSDDR